MFMSPDGTPAYSPSTLPRALLGLLSMVEQHLWVLATLCRLQGAFAADCRLPDMRHDMPTCPRP